MFSKGKKNNLQHYLYFLLTLYHYHQVFLRRPPNCLKYWYLLHRYDNPETQCLGSSRFSFVGETCKYITKKTLSFYLLINTCYCQRSKLNIFWQNWNTTNLCKAWLGLSGMILTFWNSSNSKVSLLALSVVSFINTRKTSLCCSCSGQEMYRDLEEENSFLFRMRKQNIPKHFWCNFAAPFFFFFFLSGNWGRRGDVED